MVDQRRHPLQPRNFSQSTTRDRFELVRPLVEKRSVLDIGAGTGQHRADWVHLLIAEVATEVVGLELDDDLAASARARGFDVRTGDAQSTDLGRTFEAVFAGEVIEHLSCAGAFLDTLRRHLVPGGHLVLTTPNAFAVSNFVYRFGTKPRFHEEHTCWYCEDTIRQILERHGFDAVVSYARHTTPGRLRRVLAGTVRALLPERLAQNTLMVVAVPRPD